MTGIRTILSVVGDEATGEAPLRTALVLARDLGCHVEGFHVRIDASAAVPYVGEAMAGALVEEMVEAAEKEARERAAKAHGLFARVCAELAIALDDTPPGTGGPSASWQEARGAEPEHVAMRGRVADLLVLGQPGLHGEPPSLLTLNAALLESGRPVLVAPPQAPAEIGRRIAIAWNGSAEAARAVMGAMPFLVAAQEVTVLIAEIDEEGADATAHELERHLAWHGVKAGVRVLHAAAGTRAGEALVAASDEVKADLLVMGAYTHSRLRQLILGGVTRHLLGNARIPLLLSH
ncbi:universal stress protein UspA [Rhodospirillum rubrum]|uniref:universal stress protein n=1 Tax=Rhodospirillum rubrum TaxID=1085 RepID=UPI0019041C58|nr:universal stress protein [Rhodospirillum rubrum]MBK1665867.1 universal stress protein UspA [Rhodospirillum rubrum]MBK1677612.1 universal stress protein UspA [Rhodospirillum rubrum]